MPRPRDPSKPYAGFPNRLEYDRYRASLRLRHDACPRCGEEKRKVSEFCQACRRAVRASEATGMRMEEGYHLKYVPGRRWVGVHRLVMEGALGRQLGRDELVHHRNGDPQDNRLENLELVSPQTHMHRHRKHNWALIAELYEQGHGTPTIGKMLGFHHSVAWHALRTMGLLRTRPKAAG